MKKIALMSGVFGLSLMLVSCSGSTTAVVPQAGDNGDGGGYARPGDTLGGLPKPPVQDPTLNVLLTDAAPRLGALVPTEIDLGISEVDAISNGTVIPIAQYATPVVVNVLAEQDQPGSIGIGNVWSNAYDHIRFVVDVPSSKVVANGASYPISFPGNAAIGATVASNGSTATQVLSSSSVAMTVSGSFTVGGSPADAVEADFNAFESLKLNNAGAIVARPALFAVPSALAGKVSGSVVNAKGVPVSGATVVALGANGAVANTDNTAADGSFKMHTLAAGSYHLVVYDSYKTNAGQTISAVGATSTSSGTVDGGYVTVTAGQTTIVPTVRD